MNADHDAVRILLGAYVLGGLGEADLRTVEAHLPACGECRDELARSAPLPGLLRRVAHAPAQPREPVPDGQRPVPDPRSGARGDSLGRLLEQVRRSSGRRRTQRLRWLSLAAAFVVVSVLGLGLLVVPGRDGHPGGARSETFAAAAGYTVSGRASLSVKPWGTAVSVELAGLPAQGPFVLRVAAADGRSERAAAWAETPTESAVVTGASSFRLPDIRAVSVLDRQGRVLATARAS